MEMKQLEPYRSGSSLPNELYYLSVETGNQEFQKELFEVEYSDEERKGVRKTEATIGLLGALRSQARVGNFELAAEKLKPVYVGALLDRHILDRHVLEQVSGLAEKSIASSYAFTRKLFDQTIREDSLRLLAGRSIRLGKGPELWKLMDLDVNLKPTDKATAYLGFLEGIQATTGK